MLPIVNITQILLVIGVIFVVMVVIFIFVIILLMTITYEPDIVHDRLTALKNNQGDLLHRQQRGPFDEARESLINFSAPIAKSLYSQNASFLKKTKFLLTEAGQHDNDAAVWRCLAGQVATGLVMGVAMFVGSLFIIQNIGVNLGAGVFGLLLGRMASQFMLRIKAGKRKDEIRYNLPDALDLMVVCVEAGLGLDATIHRVAEDVETLAPDIATEFKRLNRELNAGVPRMEAFQNLGTRSGVEELKSLCALIIQSDKLGTSVADTLRIYAEDMRVRRRQKAEELAAKASIKITFPLVLFIFPPLFIVLLGPTVISAFKTFGGGDVFPGG